MNEEYSLLGAIVKQALEDLTATDWELRIKAYRFLYRKYDSLMGFVNCDTDYLVKKMYGSLKPKEKIEQYLAKRRG